MVCTLEYFYNFWTGVRRETVFKDKLDLVTCHADTDINSMCPKYIQDTDRQTDRKTELWTVNLENDKATMHLVLTLRNKVTIQLWF